VSDSNIRLVDFTLVLPNGKEFKEQSYKIDPEISRSGTGCDGGFNQPNVPLPGQTWMKPLVEFDKVQC
ncbi:hypothetical protein PENTCL1PPCAC_5497, partial [Pristionchus entomophagus]